MFSRFGAFTPSASSFPLNTMAASTRSGGLLSSLFGGLGRGGVANGAIASVAKKGINWGSLLTNTQKTLGIINQTIPTINQIKPIWNNAKTMFKVMNEFKNNDSVSSTKNNQNLSNQQNNNSINNSNTNSSDNNSGPNFFI